MLDSDGVNYMTPIMFLTPRCT